MESGLRARSLFRALNEEASRFVYEDPFAFALGASLDRGIRAEVAWTFPFWIREKLGHLDPQRIASMSLKEISKVLELCQSGHATDAMLPAPSRALHDSSLTKLVVMRPVSGAAKRHET